MFQVHPMEKQLDINKVTGVVSDELTDVSVHSRNGVFGTQAAIFTDFSLTKKMSYFITHITFGELGSTRQCKPILHVYPMRTTVGRQDLRIIANSQKNRLKQRKKKPFSPKNSRVMPSIPSSDHPSVLKCIYTYIRMYV
jgi:hypothetical protein